MTSIVNDPAAGPNESGPTNEAGPTSEAGAAIATGIDTATGIDPDADIDPDVRAWSRVCRGGAIAAVAWSVVLQVLIGALVPPIALTGVVFAILAFAVRPQRRRVALAAGVLAALATVANLPMTIDELSHPSSGVAFSMTLLITLAGIVMAVAGIAAFARLGSRAARPLVTSAGTVMLVGVAVAAVASFAVDSSLPVPGDVEVVAQQNAFGTTSLELEAGSTGFWLDNRDGIRHTLTLDGTDQELEAPGYSAQRADFDLAPGTWVLTCTVPGHEAMRIDVTVTG